MFRAAILTISDTASRDLSLDKSGPRIEQLLIEKGIFTSPAKCKVVPDDAPLIRAAVQDWCDGQAGAPDLLITTGGTGFGRRDITPEALTPLIERHAPGLVHLILSSSLEKTPMAALSRPLAGTYKNTLIVTLPGSVKAVAENMEALLSGDVIQHALDLIRGGSGGEIHSQLLSAEQRGVATRPAHDHHHYHHGAPTPRSQAYLSHDPSKPVTERHRISQYPLVSLAEAFKAIETSITPLGIVTRTVDASLSGYVLAESIFAANNIPSRRTTSVDGYAAKAPVSRGPYKVTSSSHSLSKPLPPETVYRINTGAPLPSDADTVIMVEDTEVLKTYEDSDGEREEAEINVLADIPVGDNIREPGSDVRARDLVLNEGTVIGNGGGEIGTLAFIGSREVKAYAKPKVALLSTGDELEDLHLEQLSSSGDFSGIYDTNRPALKCLLQGLGYEVLDLGIAKDSTAAHEEIFTRGLEQADLVLTTGGSSMGSTDLVKPVIERKFNGTIHFGRVSMKPGKPTTFATIAIGDRRKPVFALPGNPASALVTTYLFVIPALRLLGGWNKGMVHLPRIPVKINNTMRLDPRPEFHRVIIHREEGGLVASSTGGQRSSRAGSLANANGLVCLPAKTDQTGSSVSEGSVMDAVLIGEIHPSRDLSLP